MADFFFFTDIDLLQNQSTTQAYGPAGTVSGVEKFRVSSLHSAIGAPNAYAVCDGVVCVQQDSSNASLVNLILKPNQNPDMNFSTIKYIIYKGILKSSLFDGAGNVAVDSTNNLTESIKRSWDAYIAESGEASSLASENSLGIDLTGSVTNYADTDSIDNLFYLTAANFHFPSVNGGWVIGKFDATSFGLTIITERIGYDPKLKLVRNNENFVEVPVLSGSATNAQTFEYWHKKEEILNFIDPCAFYGMFYSERIMAKLSSNVFTKKDGNQIYDDILKGAQHTNLNAGNFFNRTLTYLDIRNDYNQSFNYYKNYGDDIQIAYDNSSPLTTISYYQSGWPILTIDNSIFPTGNTGTKNILRIALPLEVNNTKPLAYISQGYKHFSMNTFRKLKGKKKFVDLQYISSNLFSNEIEIVVPNNSNAGDTSSISSNTLIRYFKQIDDEFNISIQVGNSINKIYPIDNIFLPFAMKIPFSSTSGVKFKVYNEEVLLSKSNGKGTYIANVGLAEDNYNYTFFAYAKDVKQRFGINVSKPISLATQKTTEQDHFLTYMNTKIFNKKLKIIKVNLSPNDIDVLDFSPDNIINLALEKITASNDDEILLLVIDKSTFNSFQSLLTSNNVLTNYKVFFGANKLDTLPDDNENPYTIFGLTLKGFVDNAGNMETIEIPTTINLYSHDNI